MFQEELLVILLGSSGVKLIRNSELKFSFKHVQTKLVAIHNLIYLLYCGTMQTVM